MASPVQMALLGYDSGFVAPAGCRGSLIVSKPGSTVDLGVEDERRRR
jgi:hypothetical protein